LSLIEYNTCCESEGKQLSIVSTITFCDASPRKGGGQVMQMRRKVVADWRPRPIWSRQMGRNTFPDE
jgi:hypothetical protein